MSKRLLKRVIVCSLLLVPVAYAADQVAATVPVEYELVNDFAARLQTHLQQTSKILEQLRQTTNPVERKKLMNAYLAAMHTTTHITQTMQQLLDGGKDMGGMGMMGGGMMKDGKCAMMCEGKGGKQGEASKTFPPAGGDSADRTTPDADEHEGHH
jgi:hypothetical protein